MAIKGLNSLLAKLDALGENSDKALVKGIQKATKEVQGDAKDLCPVDNGTLRNSITTSVQQKGDAIIGKVGTNMEYAAYVEFGTGQRGKDADIEAKEKINLSYKEDWSGMAPQPYLYPALKQNEGVVKEIIKDEVQKEIRKVAR